MHNLHFVAGVTALAMLSGCSLLSQTGKTVMGGGLVVGDEPNAVEAGVAALAHGGNAVDAVTATYFALSVAYPVAGGLGGGGLCIVHDSVLGKTEAFDFLAREARRGGEYAVPGNVSGFSLIQGAFGRLPWQRLISPAEGSAAAGFAISQALAMRLTESQDVIRLDAGLASEFLDESGQVKPAGTIVTAPALAQTLSAIRSNGISGFYRGSIADNIVAYSSTEGGAITTDELASYRPRREGPTQTHVGDQTVYLPPAGTGAGKFAATLLSYLVDTEGHPSAEKKLAAATASATKEALDAYGIRSLPRDLGATGFAAADREGQAAACAVTMNGPFGSGRTAGTTGVTLARAPGDAKVGLAAAFLTPVVAISAGAVSLSGAGAGGPNGTAGIALALLKLARGQDVTHPGTQASTGIAPYDTVNVIGCQNDICTALPDPGAYGLGAAAGS